jgi:hypothetical protein
MAKEGSIYLRTYSVSPYVNQVLHNCTVWEAARATSAMPDIFRPIDITESNMISDIFRESIESCYGNSNPTEKLLEEANRVYGSNRRVRCVLSIGTGLVARADMISPYEWNHGPPSIAGIVGKIQWECEQTHECFTWHNLAQDAQNKFYFRLNPERWAEDAELQDWNQIFRLDAAVGHQLAREPMKTEVGKLADLLCDQTPRREYHTFRDLDFRERNLGSFDQILSGR